MALAVGAVIILIILLGTSAFYEFPPGMTGNDPLSMTIIFVIMLGISFTVLPRGIANMHRSQQAMAKQGGEISGRKNTRAPNAGWNALAKTMNNIGPLLLLAGPWIVLAWSAGFLADYLTYADPAAADGVRTQLVSLAMLLAFPAPLVAWHRYLLEEDKPLIALPNRATLGYLWRLWITIFLLGIMTTLVASNAADVARLLGTGDTALVGQILFWAMLLAMIYLGSSYALAFPATALGNRLSAQDSLLLAKPLGFGFRIGFLISLLPFAVMAWLLGRILVRTTSADSMLAIDSLRLLLVTAVFLSLASCATYLSDAYAARESDN